MPVVLLDPLGEALEVAERWAALDPELVCDITRTVGIAASRADGSADWTVLIGNATAFLAWLDPAVARDLLAGRSDVVVAACFGPTGRLVPDGAARRRPAGRWPFGSGCRHADWFATGAFVTDGEQPRRRPDGGPDTRLAFVPASAVQPLGNWDAAGLPGTGSDDIAVTDAVVPDEHTIAPFTEPARFDGAMYRLPFFTLIGVMMAGFPLGVGRRALDEFTMLANQDPAGIDRLGGDRRGRPGDAGPRRGRPAGGAQPRVRRCGSRRRAATPRTSSSERPS